MHNTNIVCLKNYVCPFKAWRESDYAGAQNDIIFNPYATTALAPWGPAEGWRE